MNIVYGGCFFFFVLLVNLFPFLFRRGFTTMIEQANDTNDTLPAPSLAYPMLVHRSMYPPRMRYTSKLSKAVDQLGHSRTQRP